MAKRIIATLLLDSVSRKFIKTNVIELGTLGINIVNSFDELTQEVIQECANVVVLESYLQNQNSYSDLRLFKALLNLKYTFIGLDEALLSSLEEYGNTFHGDPTMLDLDMIQGALFQDSALEDSSTATNKYLDNASFAKKVLETEDLFDLQLQNLAREYLNLFTEFTQIEGKFRKTIENCKKLQNLNAKLEVENNSLTNGFAEMLSNAVTLNKSLREFERIMSQDIYTKVNLSSYPNKPMIIYLKEIDSLVHQDSLIEILFEVMRLQGRQSVKVLHLFDGANCRKVKALPYYYHNIRNQFLVSELTTNDFISKVGDYTEVLDILLTNKTGLDVLILVDCKSMDDTVLNGASVYLNLCRRREDIAAYDLSAENTIVNGEETEGYLVWGDYPELRSMSSKEERFIYLASRPLIQSVVDLVRLLSASV